MNSSRQIKTLALVCVCLCSNVIVAQSKQERAVKTESVSISMYNSTKNKEALELYGEASEKHKAGNFKGAIKLYEKAVDKDPNFVEAYDDMALSYRKLGDLKNAIKYYERSIELYPDGTMAHMNLGVVYGIQKEYAKAITQYEKVQKINPEDPEGYYGLINIYLMLGETKNAIKSATKTLEIYEATNNQYLSEDQYLLVLSIIMMETKRMQKHIWNKPKKADCKLILKLQTK